jgi:molybdopterin-guanine dinucleotide biosynthesis protein A
MYAIVLAGGVPEPGEPLYEFTLGQPKALLEIAGKPMVQWVLDAISGSKTVEHVLIVGLPEGMQLSCTKTVHYFPQQEDMLTNIFTGMKKVLEMDPTARHTLIVSSDIPTITAEMVDWVVEAALQTDHDVYYNLIERHVMEARFPGSKRTYTRLKGIEVCGGDMNVAHTLTVTANDEAWRRIIASRKNVFKQASLVGLDVLLLLLLGQITLDETVKRVSKRMRIKGRAILCPFAEVGMDIDKPHQLALVRSDMENRQGAAPAA